MLWHADEDKDKPCVVHQRECITVKLGWLIQQPSVNIGNLNRTAQVRAAAQYFYSQATSLNQSTRGRGTSSGINAHLPAPPAPLLPRANC
jgi:hypothetical protein